jgi:hypothetical protein
MIANCSQSPMDEVFNDDDGMMHKMEDKLSVFSRKAVFEVDVFRNKGFFKGVEIFYM